MVKRIQAFVCKQHQIKMVDLLGKSRVASLVQVRHIAMSASQSITKLSSYSLAELFNRWDHVTILHAVKRVKSNEKLRISARQIVEYFREQKN